MDKRFSTIMFCTPSPINLFSSRGRDVTWVLGATRDLVGDVAYVFLVEVNAIDEAMVDEGWCIIYHLINCWSFPRSIQYTLASKSTRLFVIYLFLLPLSFIFSSSLLFGGFELPSMIRMHPTTFFLGYKLRLGNTISSKIIY